MEFPKGLKIKCFFFVSFFVFSEDFEVDTVFPRISSNALTSALPQIHTQPLGNNFKFAPPPHPLNKEEE